MLYRIHWLGLVFFGLVVVYLLFGLVQVSCSVQLLDVSCSDLFRLFVRVLFICLQPVAAWLHNFIWVRLCR